MKCWVGDCKHHQTRDKCKYFTVPFTPLKRRRRSWKLGIGNAESPPLHARICSCHFKDGEKEEGPTIFKRQRNPKYQHLLVSPKMKTRKPSRSPLFDVSSIDEPGASADADVSLDEPSASTRVEEAVIGTPVMTGGAGCKKSLFVKPVAERSETPPHATAFLSPPKSVCSECFKSPCMCKENVVRLRNSLAEARRQISQLHLQKCKVEDVVKQLQVDLRSEKELPLYPKLFKDDSKAISKENQIFLTLMKLRQAFTHGVLCDWFGVSESTVTNIVRTWVSALHTIIFKTMMKTVPFRYKNKQSLPECFAPYPNCRLVVDCTELRVEIPDAMRNKNLVHSGYERYSTAKAAVAVAPNGIITFVSDMFPGSNSDKTITRESGILEILQPGDLVLADKGFLIHLIF